MWGDMVPGDDADNDLPLTSTVVVSVEGVACTEMYLYPPTLRPAMKCAGNAHCVGLWTSLCRLLDGI